MVCGYCGTTFVTAAPGPSAGPPGVNPEVLRQLRAGQKIGAIKAYREATGCSLAEAKDAVEAIERAIR
jgi:ribosomal protein L7/L12